MRRNSIGDKSQTKDENALDCGKRVILGLVWWWFWKMNAVADMNRGYDIMIKFFLSVRLQGISSPSTTVTGKGPRRSVALPQGQSIFIDPHVFKTLAKLDYPNVSCR